MQLEKIKKEREQLFEKNKIRKEEIAKLDEMRRQNILYEENNILDRVFDMELDEYDRKQMLQKRNFELQKDNFDLRKDFLKRLMTTKHGHLLIETISVVSIFFFF